MSDEKIEDEKPSTAMTRSVGGSDLASGLSTVVDAGIDVGIAAVHGIPILSVFVGLAKAGLEVRQALQYNKIVRFLQGVETASAEARAAFTEKLEKKGRTEAFGENVLLILDRLDDIEKPKIVGRIVAACINGHMDYEIAMRLCAMVSRCYATDLRKLRNFKPGFPHGFEETAAMLAADGLLINSGFEAGTIDNTEEGYSGLVYELSKYGELLIKFGFD